MRDHPAGLFAVWSTAWLTGRTSYDEALDALVGDTAHRVVATLESIVHELTTRPPATGAAPTPPHQ